MANFRPHGSLDRRADRSGLDEAGKSGRQRRDGSHFGARFESKRDSIGHARLQVSGHDVRCQVAGHWRTQRVDSVACCTGYRAIIDVPPHPVTVEQGNPQPCGPGKAVVVLLTREFERTPPDDKTHYGGAADTGYWEENLPLLHDYYLPIMHSNTN